MNDSPAQASSPSGGWIGRIGPGRHDEAVLQALRATCRLHEGSVTVAELVWAWTADLWWDAVTDPNSAVDPTAIPHTPSRADLAWVRRRLAALHH